MSIISATWEVEIKKNMVQGQPGKKLVRPYFKNKLGKVEHFFNPSYARDRDRRIIVLGQPRPQKTQNII
jgi:hypothetical protein